MYYSVVWDSPVDGKGRGVRKIGDPANVRLHVDLSSRPDVKQFQIINRRTASGAKVIWSNWVPVPEGGIWSYYSKDPILADRYLPGEYGTFLNLDTNIPGFSPWEEGTGFVLSDPVPSSSSYDPQNSELPDLTPLAAAPNSGTLGYPGMPIELPPPEPPASTPPASTPPHPTITTPTTPTGATTPAVSYRTSWQTPTDSQGRGLRKVGDPANVYQEIHAPAGQSVSIVNERLNGGVRVAAAVKIPATGVLQFSSAEKIPANYQPGEYRTYMEFQGVRYQATSFVVEAGGDAPPPDGGNSDAPDNPANPPGGSSALSGGSGWLWLVVGAAALLIFSKRGA